MLHVLLCTAESPDKPERLRCSKVRELASALTWYSQSRSFIQYSGQSRASRTQIQPALTFICLMRLHANRTCRIIALVQSQSRNRFDSGILAWLSQAGFHNHLSYRCCCMSQERAWSALASNASSRHMQAGNSLNEELAGSCSHFSHAAMEWCSARGKHIKRDMHNSLSQKMTARQSPSGS